MSKKTNIYAIVPQYSVSIASAVTVGDYANLVFWELCKLLRALKKVGVDSRKVDLGFPYFLEVRKAKRPLFLPIRVMCHTRTVTRDGVGSFSTCAMRVVNQEMVVTQLDRVELYVLYLGISRLLTNFGSET